MQSGYWHSISYIALASQRRYKPGLINLHWARICKTTQLTSAAAFRKSGRGSVLGFLFTIILIMIFASHHLVWVAAFDPKPGPLSHSHFITPLLPCLPSISEPSYDSNSIKMAAAESGPPFSIRWSQSVSLNGPSTRWPTCLWHPGPGRRCVEGPRSAPGTSTRLAGAGDWSAGGGPPNPGRAFIGLKVGIMSGFGGPAVPLAR